MKLGLQFPENNFTNQKLDGYLLKIFEIVVASFKVENNFKKLWFI